MKKKYEETWGDWITRNVKVEEEQEGKINNRTRKEEGKRE